ncbi:MAG: hypothetical protein COA79_26385 [Planctomycetota bacterium]|nr:MAG: hypothetical protein COA79_26385 [Planctomycetota bacterium]
MKSKGFSLIEILTVIIVILVLITLFVPSFHRIRTKANTAICANQMKQIGTLLSIYSLDNNGYLPFSGGYRQYFAGGSYKDIWSYRDIPQKISGWDNRNLLYHSWPGHLLPYFDLNLETYSRAGISYNESTGKLRKPTKVNDDPMYHNFILVEEMLYEGGHGPLKVFVCPEAVSTPDARALTQGFDRPRVSSSSMDKYSSTNEVGLPSSYLGHKDIFGSNSKNSMKLEDISTESLLIAEGSNYGTIYGPNQTFHTGPGSNAYSAAGTFAMRGAYGSSNYIGGTTVLFSYMHDNTKEIWVSDFVGGYSSAFVNRFNKAYNPMAAAAKDWGAPEHGKGLLASSQYPREDWSLYKSILQGRNYKIDKFHSEDSGKNYFFGNMNILRGDLSISKKHIGWIYENKINLSR